jgi:hypothetical protein
MGVLDVVPVSNCSSDESNSMTYGFNFAFAAAVVDVGGDVGWRFDWRKCTQVV